MTPQTTCVLAEQWIYLSIDGELSDAIEKQLERHLDGCDRCRALADQASEEQLLLTREIRSVAGAMDQLLDGRLSDSDISREERERSDAVAPFGRSGIWVAAAALVIFGVGLVFWMAADSNGDSVSLGTLAWTENGLTVNGSPEALSGSRSLQTDEEIEVPIGSVVTLRFDDGTVVDVYGGSRYCVRRREAPCIELRRGRVSCVVPKQQESDPQVKFLVQTPILRVEVVGTEFDVKHDLDRGSIVDVTSGLVRVEHRVRNLPGLDLAAGDTCRAYLGDGMQYTYDDGEWEWKRKSKRRWVLEVRNSAPEVVAPEVVNPPTTSIRPGKPPVDPPTKPSSAGRAPSSAGRPLDMPVGNDKHEDEDEDEDN